MKVCVIGLGKMGFPLAVQYASKGFKVTGCDTNKDIVDFINRGECPLGFDEANLTEKFKVSIKKDLIRATTNTTKAVSESDIIVCIVPLVVDEKKNLDYSMVDSACKNISKGLKKGSLVIFETTLAVGDTRNRIAKILENSGLKAGKDFYVAFSPERVESGTVLIDLKRYPKLVGGIDEKSTEKARRFYSKSLDAQVISLNNSEEAEFAKLMGMVYRDANIALANDFAKLADSLGIDITKVIEACNTNPKAHVLKPGIGAGGHCLPVYPYLLLKNYKEANIPINLLETARSINDNTPNYNIKRLKNKIKSLKGKNILVLGLSYRANIKEDFLSPALGVIKALKEEKANVYVNDSFFTQEEIEKHDVKAAKLDNLPKLDVVVLVSYHDQYKKLNFKTLRSKGVKVILDGRNVLDKKKIEALGMKYIGIGR